jgi:hypothetical protein
LGRLWEVIREVEFKAKWGHSFRDFLNIGPFKQARVFLNEHIPVLLIQTVPDTVFIVLRADHIKSLIVIDVFSLFFKGLQA